MFDSRPTMRLRALAMLVALTVLLGTQLACGGFSPGALFATQTPLPTATHTPTSTPAATATQTATQTPTFTPTPTATATQRPTQTPTRTPIPTNTSPPTNTPLPTSTPVPTHTPIPAPTNTPRPSWANLLYNDLVQTLNEARMVLGWYQALWRGESVRCPSQSMVIHRPSYEIPPELGALRSIYDRYLAAIPLVDGVGDEIGPLDRIQLLCYERKNIGEADMRFDTQKLEQAVGILEGLVAEAAAQR